VSDIIGQPPLLRYSDEIEGIDDTDPLDALFCEFFIGGDEIRTPGLDCVGDVQRVLGLDALWQQSVGRRRVSGRI